MPHGHKRATIALNIISSYVLQEEMQCKTLYLPLFYEGLKPFRENILTLSFISPCLNGYHFILIPDPPLTWGEAYPSSPVTAEQSWGSINLRRSRSATADRVKYFCCI